MISTGIQTEQHHLSDHHAHVDLGERFESLATTTSAALKCTAPEIDENNNLDYQKAPPSYCSRECVFEECYF